MSRSRALIKAQIKKRKSIHSLYLSTRKADAGFAEFLSEHIAELGCRWRDRVTLRDERGDSQCCWLESVDDTEPLVTVRIATKDRPDLLVERAVASAIRQTYTNIEILVVGDGCDHRTGKALAQLSDPRIRYVNLGRSGRYPIKPWARWHVAGTAPMNASLLLASGDWLTPCDDDDEMTDDHVEKLLRHARNNNLELVWSKSEVVRNGSVRIFGDERFKSVTQGSILYSMGLSSFMYSPTCHRLGAPADQRLWARMRKAGVRMGFLDAVTYRYFPAGSAQYRCDDSAGVKDGKI